MTKSLLVRESLQRLASADLAGHADSEPRWPEQSWQILQELGGTRWAIPAEYGGEGRHGIDLLERYEALAGACLTTCFILSQRDAAVRRICDLASEELRRLLLPPLARGEAFATVGLSQLTTSHQHGKPAVTGGVHGDAIVIDGVVPWVTGAARAAHIVTGGTLADGRQFLTVLPTDSAGVSIGKPLDLMALEGSLTAEIRCASVRLTRNWLLAGPTADIMKSARGGTGGLETSCLAIGLAGAAVAHVLQEAAVRPDLRDDADRLQALHQRVRQQLYGLARDGASAEDAQNLRAAANTLALQASQTALTASKGAGFLREHPAQRWARQALFFLVWSCPRPVASATVGYILSAGDGVCL